MIAEARHHEKNYIIAPADESINQVNRITKGLKTQAAAPQTKLTETASRALMDAVTAKTISYETSFKVYVDLEHQRAETLDDMSARADETLEKIESLVDSQGFQSKEIREKNRAYITAKLQKAGKQTTGKGPGKIDRSPGPFYRDRGSMAV